MEVMYPIFRFPLTGYASARAAIEMNWRALVVSPRKNTPPRKTGRVRVTKIRTAAADWRHNRMRMLFPFPVLSAQWPSRMGASMVANSSTDAKSPLDDPDRS